MWLRECHTSYSLGWNVDGICTCWCMCTDIGCEYHLFVMTDELCEAVKDQFHEQFELPSRIHVLRIVPRCFLFGCVIYPSRRECASHPLAPSATEPIAASKLAPRFLLACSHVKRGGNHCGASLL
jgi:hypothetical protein